MAPNFWVDSPERADTKGGSTIWKVRYWNGNLTENHLKFLGSQELTWEWHTRSHGTITRLFKRKGILWCHQVGIHLLCCVLRRHAEPGHQCLETIPLWLLKYLFPLEYALSLLRNATLNLPYLYVTSSPLPQSSCLPYLKFHLFLQSERYSFYSAFY